MQQASHNTNDYNLESGKELKDEAGKLWVLDHELPEALESGKELKEDIVQRVERLIREKLESGKELKDISKSSSSTTVVYSLESGKELKDPIPAII